MGMAGLLLLLAAGGPDSPYLRRDLDRLEADWLAVAPPAFAGELDVLCAHRAKSLRPAVVRTDDVAARHGTGPEGIARLVAAARPRFLLLCGDVGLVPTFVRRSEYSSPDFASDPDLATDHLFGAIAGRFPADTAEELRTMAARTVEFETALPPGRWRRKIDLVASEGGFGAPLDALLEFEFARVVAREIPPAYDVEIAFAKPSSRYCVHPPAFRRHVLGMIRQGALLFAYVGHGRRSGFDDLRWNGSAYPILESRDADSVEAPGGRPIMAALACSTGQYDAEAGDALGEELMKRKRGPVAFLGGSRITQPYGNALLGRLLLKRFLDPRLRTLGEVLWEAKAGVSEKDASPFRLRADALAAMIQGPAGLEPMRKDVVLHYNLLGDPALAIPRPSEDLGMETLGILAPGRRIRVLGRASEGPAEVTLEHPRDRVPGPGEEPEGEGPEARMARRYARANDPVVVRTSVPVREGRFEAILDLPEDLRPGPYYLKAQAGTSIGALEVEIRD